MRRTFSTAGVRAPAAGSPFRRIRPRKWASSVEWLETFGFTVKKNNNKKHYIGTFAQQLCLNAGAV